MAEGGTTAEFARWAEPHLTALARYAGRRVAPAERDEVVLEALVRARQRWSAYDASRGTPLAWLLAIMANESPRDRVRQPGPAVVELVDQTGAGPQTRDVDLERAVEGLGRRERQAVDLHYYVGVDASTVATVARCSPQTVALRLAQARDRLHGLLGDDEGHLMDPRLTAAGRRWQEEQPPPPAVPLRRLDQSLPRRGLPRGRAWASAAVVLLAGGSLAVAMSHDTHGDRKRPEAKVSPTPSAHRAARTVPFRDLDAAHPELGRDHGGVRVTPYDGVSASGDFPVTVHAGDILVFDAALEAPGMVSLLPCPDYTITVGTLSTTRQLNCAQVPYYASLVRSTGQVTSFRPVLPAGTQVLFRMRVTVPDQPGRQQVRWSLDGPHEMPGFTGLVEVTPR